MKIMTSAFFLAAILTLQFGLASPARAQIYYPWCANYGGADDGGSNCGFSTLEQCRATIAGMGGSCDRNQFYTGPAEKPVKRAHKRVNG